MAKLRILLTLCTLAASYCFSCNEKAVEPNLTISSGSTTISTKEGNVGFSFSNGEILTPPFASNNYPDFIVQANTDETGAILGGFFSATNPDQSIRQAFALIHAADTDDEARQFFDSLSSVSIETFEWVTIPLIKNQIWAVKTINQNFAKMLIIDNKVIDGSYAEVRFEWVFQSNGTRNF